MPKYTLVSERDATIADLDAYDTLGVDTEFMREKTFFAQLCLVQLATPEDIFCVDPMADFEMSSFWKEVCDKSWVVHSARQDIEVVYQAARRMPRSLFDTQIAAGLLGYAPQLGYAALVSELFGVEIAKSHTRADWTRRPLSEALLQYAAEDVQYLLPAYDALAESLDRKGRLSWMQQDSALLLDSALYKIDPLRAVDRLKGARNLRGRSRTAAAKLAGWRESEALRTNRPRQWILRDSALIELATSLPSSTRDLARNEQLPARLARRAGDELLALISDSAADHGDDRPPAPADAQHKTLLKSMQSTVAECADDLDIAPEIIASKKELSSAIVFGTRNSRVFSGWRKKQIGERLLQLL